MPRGVITSFDPFSGTGIITAEDGRTYPFTIADVSKDARAGLTGLDARSPFDTGSDGSTARHASDTSHTDHNDKD